MREGSFTHRLFTPLARSLPATVPFVGPETIERGMNAKFRARLGANESVFGPSPKVVAAMKAAAEGSWAYGDPEQHELKAAVAERLGLEPANIAMGEGIDGLLGYTAHLTVDAGDVVLSSLGAYPTFNYHVAGRGGVLELVPYREDREDLQALLDRARTLRPKLVYLANPDNPTGSFHPAGDVMAFAEALPEETILVLDEAYADMAPLEALPPMDFLRPNVLRFRTFSKAYGMAGVRVGFVVGTPESVREFDKVRNHFGLSLMAQAGAIAAVEDEAYRLATVGRIVEARGHLAGIASRAGLEPLPSATNFVAVDCGRDGAFAKAVLGGVIARGVFIRKPMAAPLDRLIRVTVGTKADLALFEEALAGSLANLR